MNIFISSSYKTEAYELILNLRNLNRKNLELNILNDPYENNNNIDSLQRYIKKSDVVIAIVNNYSNNVYYEIGYATGLGKQVLIVCSSDVDLPSNLNGLIYFEGSSYNAEVAYKVLDYLNKDIKSYNNFDLIDFDLETIVSVFETNNIDFEQLDYEHFEKIIMKSFENNGYMVVSKKSAKDYGYDFMIFDKDGNKYLIEVKKRSLGTKISINTVQQLLGAIHAYNAKGGIIISSSGFTDSALNFSEKCIPKIQMWTMEDLKEKLSSVNNINRSAY